MSSGGKDTTTVQTTENKIPAWVEDASKANLKRAEYVSKLGYTPNYGLDVAGFTPTQIAAMQNNINTAGAFGLAAPSDAMAGMPAMTTNNLGFTGYSSGNLYDDALAQLKDRNPDQYSGITDMFGANPNVVFTPVGSIASPDAGGFAYDNATYNSDSNLSDIGGGGAGALTFTQGLQNFADAPDWLSLIPLVGAAKMAATKYVNTQANKMNANGGSSTPYLNTNRGFSSDGSTYTSSWGKTYSTSGMSDATKAGLSIASSQNDTSDWSD